MPGIEKRHVALGLKISVSLTLGYLMLSNIGIEPVLLALKRVSPSVVGLSIALFILQTLVLAVRWHFVANVMGRPIALSRSVSFTYTGVFFNQALPSSFGGDTVRIWYASKSGMPLSSAINSVLLDRVVGTLALVLLCATSLSMLGQQLELLPLQTVVLGMVPLSLLLVGLLTVLDRLPLLPPAAVRFLERTRMAADARLLFGSVGAWAMLLLLSFVSHFLAAESAHVLARSLGVVVEYRVFLGLMFLVFIVLLLPISFAGWGLRESAMVVALGFVGIAPGEALAVSLLFGITMALAALPGGAVWMMARPIVK